MTSVGERLVLWLAVGAYVALTVVAFVELLLGWTLVWTWIEDHETLTAGMLALSSALIAAALLYRQISATERHELDRVRRRRQAVRTVVPLTVLSLAEYVESAGKEVRTVLEQCPGGALPDTATVHVPDLPTDGVAVLRDLAETVEASEAIFIAQLIAHIQIQRSIMKGWQEREETNLIVVKSNLVVALYEAAVLLARANALWKYARWQTTHLPSSITFDAVASALRQIDVDEDIHEEVWVLFKTRSSGNLNGVVPDRWTVAT